MTQTLTDEQIAARRPTMHIETHRDRGTSSTTRTFACGHEQTYAWAPHERSKRQEAAGADTEGPCDSCRVALARPARVVIDGKESTLVRLTVGGLADLPAAEVCWLIRHAEGEAGDAFGWTTHHSLDCRGAQPDRLSRSDFSGSWRVSEPIALLRVVRRSEAEIRLETID